MDDDLAIRCLDCKLCLCNEDAKGCNEFCGYECHPNQYCENKE